MEFLTITVLQIEKGTRKIAVAVAVCHIVAVAIGVSYQQLIFLINESC